MALSHALDDEHDVLRETRERLLEQLRLLQAALLPALLHIHAAMLPHSRARLYAGGRDDAVQLVTSGCASC